METVPRHTGEHVFPLAGRKLAYIALALLSLQSRDTGVAYSHEITPPIPHLAQSVEPHVITDNTIVIRENVHSPDENERKIYDYPLFAMTAYEDMSEQRKLGIERTKQSTINMLSGQTAVETIEGWNMIQDAIGISSVALLYNADISNAEICVVDTAFDTDHPALSSHIVYEACYSSTTNLTTSLCANGKDVDTESIHPASDDNCHGECNHGTMVGSATVMDSPFNISLFKTASAYGGDAPGLKDIDILAGFHGCLERKLQGHPVVAVNLSASHYSTFSKTCNENTFAQPYAKVFRAMIDHGIAVVVSGGNFSEKNAVGIPACVTNHDTPLADGIFSIASSTYTREKPLTIAPFSNRSTGLTTTFVPGNDIPVATRDGYYGTISGTSFSTAIMSQALVYLTSLFPHATPAEIEAMIVEGNVVQKDAVEWFGAIDVERSAQVGLPGRIFQLQLPQLGR